MHTKITFNIMESGHIRLSIYNLIGQRVIDQANHHLDSGKQVQWDGTDEWQRRMPSGM
ncbi:hypothetical protein JXJ21_09600 [candidate division KSB1 bacterium]|nr:hypothetical protein [candidate division KSB1 bacterium]